MAVGRHRSGAGRRSGRERRGGAHQRDSFWCGRPISSICSRFKQRAHTASEWLKRGHVKAALFLQASPFVRRCVQRRPFRIGESSGSAQHLPSAPGCWCLQRGEMAPAPW